MNIHKEGHLIILISAVAIGIIATLVINFIHILTIPVLIILTLVLAWVFWFFRDPVRIVPLPGDDMIYAPCDGKVVVIEKVIEPIYFKEERLLVSIFMSPLNVHVNRVPVGGIVKYNQYFSGKYLVAWHPKSSTENERNYSVIDQGAYQVGIVQIAGAMARRIINYLKTGETVKQGEELGFIRFGSRVDLYLPLDAKIEVKINDIVQGNLSCIARVEI
ncbi:MAG: phosphatidylserine decarboxylase family protein [Saprospiraceae bacterium]|nr:phosphatidylserine decarboxylase family protein [Saprospiraceae bacterium]